MDGIMKTLATPAFETPIGGLVEAEPRSTVGLQWHGGQYVFDDLDTRPTSVSNTTGQFGNRDERRTSSSPTEAQTNESYR